MNSEKLEALKEFMTEEKIAALKEFASSIREHLTFHCSYSFRPVRIDGVLCYPVIHKHQRILNFECVHIVCRVTNVDKQSTLNKYSLYYCKYTSVEEAILTIESIVGKYKIFHGDLLSPRDYKMAKLEEQFNPYTKEQVCCVCYENTMDTTVCDHYLCLKCRETCIRKEKKDCPMCRNPGIVKIYNNDSRLINNCDYKCLREIAQIESISETVYSESRSPFRIYAFIDRIGSRRSPSNESDFDPEILFHLDDPDGNDNEDLSEVSSIGNESVHELEESHDHVIIDQAANINI